MSDVAIAPTTVNSTADMLAGVDGDQFSADAASVEVPGEVGGADESTEAEPAPEPEAEPQAEEPAEPEQPEEQTEEPAEPKQAAAIDDLPEGVRKIKDRSGNEGLFVTPERWQEIYDNGYKVNQQVAEIIGEPLTTEAVELRHRALMANEQMQNDLMSGDPVSQANVLRYFNDMFANARRDGEIGVDPMVPLTEAFYSTVRDSNPDAYANLRYRAASDLVEEMYGAAAEAKNRDLWLSTSHTAKALGMKWKPDAEFERAAAQPRDPHAAIIQERDQLKQQLESRAQEQRKSEFQYFKAETGKGVRTAVLKDAIEPAIPKSVADQWAKFPTQYQANVITPLQNRVKDIIEQDAAFGRTVATLEKRAAMATNSQVRQAISEQIVAAYTNRAKLAAGAVKGQILKEAAEKFKTDNQSKHTRLQAAAQQRGPKGPQNQVPRSLIPNNVGKGVNGVATRESMLADIDRVLAGS